MEPEWLAAQRVQLYAGDCRTVLPAIGANTIDSAVMDPPYHLTANKQGGSGSASLNERSPAGRARIGTGFMGKAWDGGDVAFRAETWREVLRVLRPGGYLLAFGGTRTYHRLVCAIEDAGFEIRDQIAWMYGTGFPKSLDVSKDIDRQLGAKRKVTGTQKLQDKARVLKGGNFTGGYEGREITDAIDITEPESPQAKAWDGWGTALKPALEPVVVAQKPLHDNNVAKNVLRWGNGALNIDGCRVDGAARPARDARAQVTPSQFGAMGGSKAVGETMEGRWPANLIHDGSDEVVGCFPTEAGAFAPASGPALRGVNTSVARGKYNGLKGAPSFPGDGRGSAARFFYCAKASQSERDESKHPTVKPVALMRYLVRLVTPPRGLVLDCFAGTGTTGAAALAEGMRAVLVERELEHLAHIRKRLK